MIGKIYESSGARCTKVVMLYSKLFQPYEGWYRRVYNQAKTLVDEGIDVTILAWDRSGSLPIEEIRDGIRIRRVPISAIENRGPANILKVLSFNWAAGKYLLRNDFNIVEAFNVDTMLAGLILAKWRNKNAILDLCEPDYYRGFWKRKYEWLLSWVDALERFCAKRFDRLFIHNTYQVRKFESAGITHLTQIGSYPSVSLINSDVSIPVKSGTVVIGRLGTAYANNGFEEIVGAFRRLLKRSEAPGYPVRYKLFLAGRVFDTYRDTFETLVAPLGDNVEIRGAYDANELPALYEQIDLSLLIQGEDSFSNVTPTKLFESMARGVPVIGNRIGDMGEIVEEGQCGLAVDATDAAKICEAIERLGLNSELRLRMSENGKSLVREKYSWEANRDPFLRAYKELEVL